MKTKCSRILGLGIVLLMLAGFSLVLAQQARDVTFQVTLREWFDLSIGTNTVTFTDVNPPIQEVPGTRLIEANENPVRVRVFAIINPLNNLRLTVVAQEDFDETIPASTVSWTVSGNGYNPGSLQVGTEVIVGEWGNRIFHWHEGMFSFRFLRDYVNQEPGNYSITATFTLSKV